MDDIKRSENLKGWFNRMIPTIIGGVLGALIVYALAYPFGFRCGWH